MTPHLFRLIREFAWQAMRHPLVAYRVIHDLWDDLWLPALRSAYWSWYWHIAPTVNVLDYGARADGKADISDAVHRSVAALHWFWGGTVLVPYGTYRVQKGIVLSSKRPMRLLGICMPELRGPCDGGAAIITLSNTKQAHIVGFNLNGGGRSATEISHD